MSRVQVLVLVQVHPALVQAVLAQALPALVQALQAIVQAVSVQVQVAIRARVSRVQALVPPRNS